MQQAFCDGVTGRAAISPVPNSTDGTVVVVEGAKAIVGLQGATPLLEWVKGRTEVFPVMGVGSRNAPDW